jgi:chromate transporter
MGDPISLAPEPIAQAAGVDTGARPAGRHGDDGAWPAAAMPCSTPFLPQRRPPMTTETLLQRPEAPTRREALAFWLKLGFVSFGGPAGQIALMHEELVERRRWISESRFLHALNYCMLLPGPEAQQLATYIGWLMHRTWGGIVAGGLFVLPSLFILIGLSWIYMAFGNVPVIAGLFYGIKPAVTALVVHAGYRVGSRALKNSFLWGIAAAAFVAIFTLQVPFPLIVLAAGAIGHVGGRCAPDKFKVGGAHGKGARGIGPALIDDHTPTPEHALFTWPRFWRVIVVFLGTWVLAIASLTALYGWDATLTQMAWFFTKAAMLTFGGAYAVLPYVYQGGVDHYHWLTAAQMIDGLALGETTPGPLIMVVSFVGFVGGWTQAIFGSGSLFLAGAVAATVVTFFTFLPSFFFILLGGPFIESTHGNLRFTAPLAGITAAVVGVIVNLAVFFAYHVLWPRGLPGHFEWPSAIIGVAAAAALFRFKVGVIPVVLGSGLAGLLFQQTAHFAAR